MLRIVLLVVAVIVAMLIFRLTSPPATPAEATAAADFTLPLAGRDAGQSERLPRLLPIPASLDLIAHIFPLADVHQQPIESSCRVA
jgi:hypothetical protein